MFTSISRFTSAALLVLSTASLSASAGQGLWRTHSGPGLHAEGPAFVLAQPPTLTPTSPSPRGAVEYALDDGSGGFTIGPSQFDAIMTWGNAFVAEPGGEMITSVSVSFGDIDDNAGRFGSDRVLIAIFDDPDEDEADQESPGRLDPSNAVLRSVSTGTWQDTGPTEFVEFATEPTAVSGSFFVAVMMDVVERANPARMDQDTLGVGSWLFFSPEPILDDLSAAPFALRMSESAFVGTWMIRARGMPLAGSCAADFDGNEAVNVLDVIAFITAWNGGDAGTDLNTDGSLNVLDVVAFLTLWNAGCA